MATFRDTMASLLRNNPTIYPEPRDAMLFLMVARGEWRDGQWELEGARLNDNPMSFEDLNDMVPAHGAERLRQGIQVMQRQLLDVNMDKILEDDPTRVYFRPTYLRDFRTLQMVEGNAPPHATFLAFPANIAPDWGHAITCFHSFLEHELNSRYMLAPDIKDYASPKARGHWPAPALALQEAIQSARERLHPLLNNGQSYEDHCNARNALSRRLIDEIIEEEKSQPRSARPSP